MNPNTHRSETTIDKTSGRLTLPTDAAVLGIDGERATHYYSQAANRIIVVDTADLVRRYHLRHHSLLTWVTYVSVESGWRDLCDAEWFLERLVEALVRR